MNINFLLVITLLSLNLHAEHKDNAWTEKVLNAFQVYCYNSEARYERVDSLAKAMSLKAVKKKMLPLILGTDSKVASGYIIEFNKKTGDGILLGFAKPNACTIAFFRKLSEPYFIKKAEEYFHLMYATKRDMGLQITNFYIPNGKVNTKQEIRENGIVLMSYGKTETTKGTMTIGYLPPETAKTVF